MRGLEFTPLSSRDKTRHLTPAATESGYEHTHAKILARTLARQIRTADLYEDMGDKEIWRRGGDLNPRFFESLVLQGKLRRSPLLSQAFKLHG